MNNNKLKVSNLKGNFVNSDSTFEVNLDADNVSDKPRVNGNVNLKSFDLTLLNFLSKYSIVPENFKKVKFEKGKIT